jgi:hypothetical protein
MQTAQLSAGVSRAVTGEMPIYTEGSNSASTQFLGELHDKASAINALIEREYAGNIAYADNFLRAQGLISGVPWSREDATTSWPWPPDTGAE